MTNTERILEAIRTCPGLTDAELRVRTGIEPHQQVNQICHRLAASGQIRRIHRPGGQVANIPHNATSEPGPAPAAATRPAPRPGDPAPAIPAIELATTLVVISCSGDKAAGNTVVTGPTLPGTLGDPWRTRLLVARESNRASAHIDESTLVPAQQRYCGSFYQAAGSTLPAAASAGHIVILSGGYGALLADEPIGTYDRQFSLRDWPAGLLEECLVQYARGHALERMVAICAATTGYAKLVRRTRWATAGITNALLVTPAAEGGGAMRAVPRAAGEAFAAIVNGTFNAGWRASNGLAVHATDLRR